MNSLKQIDILDESLRISYLEQAQSTDAVPTLMFEIVFSNEGIAMAADKKQLMLERLKQVMDVLSFGQLLNVAMSEADTDEQTLSTQTGLPVSVITELRNDAVYANSVPVHFFKELLSTLRIAILPARQAIQKSFDILQQQSLFKGEAASGFSPAYRKGYYVSREAARKNPGNNEGKELFENKEALDRYLNCLEDLLK